VTKQGAKKEKTVPAHSDANFRLIDVQSDSRAKERFRNPQNLRIESIHLDFFGMKRHQIDVRPLFSVMTC
jgi:hypothetical protein